MPYLAHLDTERLKTAEQAAAVLDSLSAYWDMNQRATISMLLARLRQELGDRPGLSRELDQRAQAMDCAS